MIRALAALGACLAAGTALACPPTPPAPQLAAFAASWGSDVCPNPTAIDVTLNVAGESVSLWAAAEGPTGSGRYWRVGYRLSSDDDDARHLCVETSTIGWRTLRAFPDLPLPWADDLDEDGAPEAILWTSFALGDGGTNIENGVVAWVFEVTPDGALIFDRALTARLAGRIADAYRAPLDPPPDAFAQTLRREAATRLDQFAAGACPG